MPDANKTTAPTDPRALADAITRALGADEVAALATLIYVPDGTVPTETRVGAKLLVDAAGTIAAGTTTNDEALDRAVAAHAVEHFLRSNADAHTVNVEAFAPELAAWVGARVLFERLAREPCLVICGAGHVGAALARLARQVGYQVTLIDDRAEFVSRTLFPEAEIKLVAADDWGQVMRAQVGAAGSAAAIVIVTRGHKEDEACLSAALALRPAYVGMIGSRRRTNIVLARLRAAGMDEAALRAVRAPVGLDIGAVTPAEVALAILAEIVATRRGGSGFPLSAWRREGQEPEREELDRG